MKNKKLIVSALIFLVSGMIFSAEFTVKEVKGKVTYEISPENSKPVSVNQKLSESQVINTGINSSLVLESGGKLFTVKPMSKGTVSALALEKNSEGIKKSASISVTKIVGTSEKTSKGASTAAERASGKGEDDLEIDE